jgi:hypothetical protein
MGAPKTQTVGGGSASPVANSWNSFLQGQLWQQPGAQSVPQTMAGPAQNSGPSGLMGDIAKKFGMTLTQQQGQPSPQGTGMPGPFQQMLQGMMNPAGMQGYNPMAQLPNAPNMPSAAGGYNPAGAAIMDPMSFIGGFGGGPDLLKQYGIDIKNLLTPGAGGENVSFTPGQLKDVSTDPSFQAIQDIANRQKMHDVANLRARFGQGGNSQSSGASLAESQYLAEANPRMIAGLGDLGRQVQGMDLELMKINNAGMLGAANASRGLGGGDIGQNLGNILQFIQGTRGQDMGAASGLAGQNLSNQQGANNLNASNMLQALGMDQNMLSNLFGQQSSNALNNQSMSNNWMQTLFGGQQNLMSQLFNSFNQSNQLGTPQAQTVQTPNPWMQAAGMATTFAPMLFGMPPMPGVGQGIGNYGMSGGGPQVRPLGPNYTPNFGIGNQQPQVNIRTNG